MIIKSKLRFLEIRSAWGSFRLHRQNPRAVTVGSYYMMLQQWEKQGRET